jgi:hypothetical protein
VRLKIISYLTFDCVTFWVYCLYLQPWKQLCNVHTYHSRLIPVRVAEASQIFSQDAHVLQNYLSMRNTADVTVGKPIAVRSQSVSGVSAITPLVAFYDIHGRKREVLFSYFVPDTTRDPCVKYSVSNSTSHANSMSSVAALHISVCGRFAPRQATCMYSS